MYLELFMNVPGGVVVEQTPSDILFACDRLAGGHEQATLCTAYKVVDSDLLTWDEMVILENSDSVTYDSSDLAWRWTTMLLAELASSTFWRMLYLAGSLMEMLLAITACQYTSA